MPEDLGESGFTCQRQPDTMIRNHTAQTYDNVQPGEFPGWTKETGMSTLDWLANGWNYG